MLGQRQPRIYNFLLVWPADHAAPAAPSNEEILLEKECLSNDLIQALNCPEGADDTEGAEGPVLGMPKTENLAVIPCPWFSAFGQCPVLTRLGSCPFSEHGQKGPINEGPINEGPINEGQKNKGPKNEGPKK